MEANLNAVIEKIKREGVDEAERKAAEIVKDAEKRAVEMIKAAEAKKSAILAKADETKREMIEDGKESLKQASRDVVIALRTRIIALFDSVVRKEVSSRLTGDVMKEILVKLVTGCMEKQSFDFEIILGEQDKENLRAFLEDLLKKELRKNVVIKTSPNVKKGFLIGEKDKNVYYDFTDDAISEAVIFYANKKIKEIMDAGVRPKNDAK